MLPYVHSALNNACIWSKRPAKKNILYIAKVVNFEGTPKFWSTEENGARKDTLNKNQNIPCQHWWHGSLLFLRQFLHLVLLLLLYHSGKITLSHYRLFLLLQILHLVLFKSLQRQGELSISGDSCVVFWWARYGNCRLLFLKRDDLPFVLNVFFAIYFWPIFIRQFWKVFLLVLQQCGDDCAVIGGRWTPFDILGCAVDLMDGAQCKFKCNNDFFFPLPCELVGWLTIAKSQALQIVYHKHANILEHFCMKMQFWWLV